MRINTAIMLTRNRITAYSNKVAPDLVLTLRNNFITLVVICTRSLTEFRYTLAAFQHKRHKKAL